MEKKGKYLMYKFLIDDYHRLEEEIKKLKIRIREIGKDMGDSCKEGAETFHDNFAYEQGERDQRMWSQKLREFQRLKNHIQIVRPSSSLAVSIGKNVRIKNCDREEEEIFIIGSFLTFDDNHISYAAPLAKLLIGAKAGEMRTGNIGGSVQTFLILDVT